jgi:hypothetical protein
MDRLKILLAALVVGLAGILSASAEAIKAGDSREAVIDALGEPDGGVTMGDTEFLYYKRGQVEIKNGQVSNHTIVSQAEADALAAKRQEAENKYFAEMEKQKERQRERAAARQAAATPDKKVKGAKLTPAEIRKQAEIEAKIQEGLKTPGIKTSARKLRKYRRGRSQSAIDAREAELRKQYEQD